MSQRPAGDSNRAIVLIALLMGWLTILAVVGQFTYGYGPLTFAMLLAMSLIVLFGRPLVRWLLGLNARIMATSLFASVLAAFIIIKLVGLIGELRHPDNRDWAVDSAVNTYLAGSHFLEGRNPYANYALTVPEVLSGPYIEVDERGTTIFGVPYNYGYPYFPVMFLSYLPGRLLASGYHSLRVENGILLLINVIGIVWLVLRASKDDTSRWMNALAAGIAYIGVPVVQRELFAYAIPDMVLSTYALYGYLALSYERFWLAGFLLGVAQAAKLLPGPLLVIPALLWLWRKPGFYTCLTSYVAGTALFIVPFLVWDATNFISSTVFWLLTYHTKPDSTGLYLFLPQLIRDPFRVVGSVLSIACACWAIRTRHRNVAEPLALAFASYALFTAFNNKSHFNYLWGVYALGCAAVFMLVSANRQRRVQTEAQ